MKLHYIAAAAAALVALACAAAPAHADDPFLLKFAYPAAPSGWVIDKGLKPGEKVVVGGLQLVRSGMKVQAVTAPAAGSPAAGSPAGGR